jgi:hypothetical protein
MTAYGTFETFTDVRYATAFGGHADISTSFVVGI